MLEINSIAPDFSLPDQNGNLISLSSFRGQKVVVYFYPRDNTPGCTNQAIAFSKLAEEFKKRNVVILGVSRDSVASHVKFQEKHQLTITLLSDVERKVIEAYGVWQEKKMYGKVSFGVVRTTFVIDEEGKIIKIYPKAKPNTNAQEVLDFLS